MFVRLGLFGLKALLWYAWQDTLGTKPARLMVLCMVAVSYTHLLRAEERRDKLRKAAGRCK